MSLRQRRLHPDFYTRLLHNPVSDEQIRLVAGGEAWMGTFALLVTTLVDDLLADGLSFEADVLWQDEYDEHVQTIGPIAAVDADHLVFSAAGDSYRIRITDVRAITV